MSDVTVLNSIDPVGNIILSSNKVYRGINKQYKEEYIAILNKCQQNGLLGRNIINTKIADDFCLEPFTLLFEHELVKPYIYPFEWTLLMNIDAAYAVLDLVMKLDEVGLGLKDGHRFNSAYHKGHFYWIDFGSIISDRTYPWMFEEFINTFINQIMCMEKGVFQVEAISKYLQVETISKYLTDEQKQEWDSLKNTVLGYVYVGEISKAVKLLYQRIEFYEKTMDILSYDTKIPEDIFCVIEYFIKENQINQALLIGGSYADICFKLEQIGISVTVFNDNPKYIDFIYSQIKGKATNISPVLIDFSNPNGPNDGSIFFKAEFRFPTELVVVFNQFSDLNQTDFGKLVRNLKLFTVKYAAIEIVYPCNEECIKAITQEFDIIAITKKSYNNNKILFVKVK